MFHKAPETGPPPGADYQNIDYGLFKTFIIFSEFFKFLILQTL